MSIIKFSQVNILGSKNRVLDTLPYFPPSDLTIWYDITPTELDTYMSTVESTGTNKTITSVNVGTSIGNLAHRSAVAHPNGNIYCVPRNTGSGMLEIDPVNNTSSYKTYGVLGSLTSSSAAYFHSAVLTESGNILAIPFNYDNFVQIDPVNETATEFTGGLGLSGTVKFSGGVLGADGNVYCVPQNYGEVAIVDPVNETATSTNFGLGSFGTLAYWGGARSWKAPNKIFMAPLRQTNMLVIDTANVTATQETFSLTWNAGQNQHYGCSVDKLGNIVAIKGASLGTLTDKIIDPDAMTGIEFNRGSGEVYGVSGIADDGNVYAVSSGDTVFFDTSTDSITTSGAGGHGLTNAFAGATDSTGNVVIIPDNTSSTIKVLDVDGNLSDGGNSANIILTTYLNTGRI